MQPAQNVLALVGFDLDFGLEVGVFREHEAFVKVVPCSVMAEVVAAGVLLGQQAGYLQEEGEGVCLLGTLLHEGDSCETGVVVEEVFEIFVDLVCNC